MKTLFLFLLISLSVHAQELMLNAAKGTVEAGDGAEFKRVSAGARLKIGQTIRTLADSTAIILYPNKSVIKMNANSTTILASLSEVSLKTGAVFAQIPKQDHPHFFIRTPSAVAGVRGTEFFTSYGGGAKTSDGWLCVREGEVEVRPESGSEPVVVKAGLGIVFKPGQKIEPPKKYEWTKDLNWNMDANAGDIVDKTSPESMYKGLLKHNYD